MSVNKVILVGRLGKDPETRTFPSGGKVVNVTLATSERWNDRQTGEKREHTEWHRLVFNGGLADVAGQYLRKGSQIYVEGSIRTREWQDQQSGQKRYSTEIRVDQMQMLGSRSDAAPRDNWDEGSSYTNNTSAYANNQTQRPDAQQSTQQAPAPSGGSFDDFADDDIPF